MTYLPLLRAANQMRTSSSIKTLQIFVTSLRSRIYRRARRVQPEEMRVRNWTPYSKRSPDVVLAMTVFRFPVAHLGVFWLLLLSTCQPDPNTAQGMAELFLDAHYVQIDLHTAKAYCAGFARNRVEEEIRLTAGLSIDATTRQPRMYYELLEETSRGESSVSFLYKADFDVDGAGRFTKNILLTLRNHAAGWRVVNYREYD